VSAATTGFEPRTWRIEEAETFLSRLNGVLSARIIARPGGEIDEVHVLTTDEVTPKQTVRNVESALLARYDLTIDHRKISVAQTSGHVSHTPGAGAMSVVIERNMARGEERILFRSHRLDTEKPNAIRITVTVEWRGRTYEGVSEAADLPRARTEATAEATLKAVEAAINEGQHAVAGEQPNALSLSLDGVKLVETFDRRFALVAVHAMSGRDIVSLAGTAIVHDHPDRAVVLATLQAVDRWVRGKVH
jgi:hypothetical protein